MRHVILSILLACGLCAVCDRAGAEPPVFPLPALTPAETARIDSVIAGFPPRDDQPHVFFIGFAGYGGERVFSEEIQFAARQVDARFATGPRTLLLINDKRDAERWPMASHENLRYALSAVGRVMEPSRDLLFLALSSHGGSNGLLEVSNFNLQPSGLGARRLAGWLNEAGIRQRIVVVSACYSGAFLKPLANNETIVITAARHDRSSFGCSDRRELTYFGEAFYRDSLPHAPTLRLAFERTAALIQSREADERVRRSLPQAYFGYLLEGRLVPQGSSVAPISQRSHSRAAPRPSLMAQTTSD
ncbi:MAG TPA: C13 family peptidase [Steroidobacteraceae bacterium]|nr:C13 family peptidase [Steroidobacteraceae bacterium]